MDPQQPTQPNATPAQPNSQPTPMPLSGEVGAVTPEAAPAPVPPEAAPQPGAGVPITPVQTPAVSPAPVTAPIMPPPAAVSPPPPPAPAVGPAVADDVDVIEKEWVDKAQEIVQAKAGDPYAEEEAVEDLQIDYLKKRYGKEIKKSDQDDKRPTGNNDQLGSS